MMTADMHEVAHTSILAGRVSGSFAVPWTL